MSTCSCILDLVSATEQLNCSECGKSFSRESRWNKLSHSFFKRAPYVSFRVISQTSLCQQLKGGAPGVCKNPKSLHIPKVCSWWKVSRNAGNERSPSELANISTDLLACFFYALIFAAAKTLQSSCSSSLCLHATYCCWISRRRFVRHWVTALHWRVAYFEYHLSISRPSDLFFFLKNKSPFLPWMCDSGW